MHISDPVQKVLLAVGTGLALIFSIVALVVALNSGGEHHGEGRMFGGAQQMQFDGPGGQRGQDGPGIGGPGQGGQRPGMMAPGSGQAAPNGTATTTK